MAAYAVAALSDVIEKIATVGILSACDDDSRSRTCSTNGHGLLSRSTHFPNHARIGENGEEGDGQKAQENGHGSIVDGFPGNRNCLAPGAGILYVTR